MTADRVTLLRAQLSEIRIDPYLVVLLVSVLGIGLVMIGSASWELAEVHYGSALHFVWRQGLYCMVGFCAALVMLAVPLDVWRIQRYPLLICAFLLLIVVLIVGREINGSVRWIPLGIVNLQASEVAKLFLVLYLAGYLVSHRAQALTSWKGFQNPLIVLLGAIGLLLLEPDFGAVVVLTTAFLGMLFLAGLPFFRFLLVAILALACFAALVYFEPYRLARLVSYMDPWAHQFDSGYQLTQSLIAFGRGGWLGQGLGNGIQKLFYLPEAHTDFIYAVLAEELGLIGALTVLGLLMAIAWRAMHLGWQAERQQLLFAAYTAYGLGLLLGTQVLINIGVNTGALPTKGLALPFLSYGGSSLIVNCMAAGLLLRVSYEVHSHQAAADESKPVEVACG